MRLFFLAALFVGFAATKLTVPLKQANHWSHHARSPKLRSMLEEHLRIASTGNHLRKRSPVLQNQHHFNLALWKSSVWYAIVQVGTPAQTFKVICDTGSADFWIRSSLCSSSSCADPQARSSDDPNNPTIAFNFRQSETFQFLHNNMSNISAMDAIPTQIIHYGTGSVQIVLGRDTLSFPLGQDGGPAITIPNQVFGLSLKQSSYPFGMLQFDGILGLGFPKLAIENTTPPLTAMVQQQVIDEGMFGYWFGTNSNDTETKYKMVTTFDNVTALIPDDSIGELTLGGFNEDRIAGPVEWIPLSRAMYWEVELLSLKYGDVDLFDAARNETTNTWSRFKNFINPLVPKLGRSPPHRRAIVDTGTALMMFPPDIGLTLQKLMGAHVMPILKNIYIQCSKIPELKPLHFTFRIYNESHPVQNRPRNVTDDSGQLANENDNFEKHEFTLHPNQYVMTPMSDTQDTILSDKCWTEIGIKDIMPDEQNVMFILGEAFLKNWYTVWDVDKERIGLADLKK